MSSILAESPRQTLQRLDRQEFAAPDATPVATLPPAGPIVDENLNRPNFSAVAIDGAVVLTAECMWGVAARFTFERSDDGMSFKTLAVVPNREREDTKFEDKTVAPGTVSHYRAKATIGDRETRYAHPIRVTAAGTKRTGSLLDVINEQRAAAAMLEAETLAENKAAGMRAYVEILLRIDRPEPNDAETLTELLADKRLGLTEARLARDVATVKEVRQKRETAAKYPPMDSQKLAALRTAEKLAKKAAEDAELAVGQYIRGVGMGQQATADLKQLAQSHADLFEPATPGQPRKFLGE